MTTPITPIPPAILSIARTAARKALLTRNRSNPMFAENLAHDIASAIDPLIRADERERAFVLVWRDERGQEICRSSPLRPGTCRIGIPLDAQHADLIREDDSDA